MSTQCGSRRSIPGYGASKQGKKSFSVLLLVGSALQSLPASSFAPIPLTRLQFTSHPNNRILSTILRAQDDEQTADGPIDFSNFNPLKPQNIIKNKRTRYGGSTISLRQTRMKEVTDRLLGCVGDKEATFSILEEYKQFLLELLEDQDAVLEPGSIYTPSMSREDRYKMYRTTVDGRIEACKNAQERQVLESMRDYILKFEDS